MYVFIIIIIRPLHSPLLNIGLSNFSPFLSIFGYPNLAPARRPVQIVTPPGLRASYTTFTEIEFVYRDFHKDM
jgi:hypothetical protein